jgi:polysaccharide biosynthesis protein PelC
MREVDKTMRLRRAVVIVLAALFVSGCGMGPTVFLNREYNFQFLEKVAVVPFDNVSDDQGAGARASRIFLSRLLAAESFDVVEPGEVSKSLEKYGTVRTSELSQDQIITLGKELKVQGIFLGSVTESSGMRSGGGTTNVVTLVMRLVETEKGTTIWSATNSAGKRGFWASLFGGGEKTQSDAIRTCIDGALKTLIK